MRRATLDGLAAFRLPEGYVVRTYQAGDSVHWERIIGESFGWADRLGKFAYYMENDPEFRPERVFFVCQGDEAVATASAWFRPAFGGHTGYLHYLGVLPSAQGKRLGREVSLACLHHMVSEGRYSAMLDTDDFRIAAIKTYLAMGFEPLLRHENHRKRWQVLLEQMNRPPTILEGPIFDPAAET